MKVRFASTSHLLPATKDWPVCLQQLSLGKGMLRMHFILASGCELLACAAALATA